MRAILPHRARRENMLTIGCHLSTSKGFLAVGQTAVSIGANTFAFFTHNPRSGVAKAIGPSDAAALRELMRTHPNAIPSAVGSHLAPQRFSCLSSPTFQCAAA